MAYIEKMCEVCRDHSGYTHEDNWRKTRLFCSDSIQVCRACLPLFKGKPFKFYWNGYPPRTFEIGKIPISFTVICPSVPGEYNGRYERWSYDKQLTRYKIRHIFGVSKFEEHWDLKEEHTRKASR